MKKEENSIFNKVIIISSILASVLLAVSVLYIIGVFGENKYSNYIEEEIPYSGKYEEENISNNKSSIENNNNDDDENQEADSNEISSEIKKLINVDNIYEFYKGTLYDNESQEKAVEELLLYKDNTYFKTSCFLTCVATSGTYTIYENKVSLIQTKAYTGENCYNEINNPLDLVYKNKRISVTSNAGKVELLTSSINDIENILTYYYEEQVLCESGENYE